MSASVALVAGWWTFWFLADDAYITFRYVSNLLAGRGLVWNPAPFAPVEGYTSIGWALLLAGVWGALGVEPPRAANALGLVCAFGTVAVTWAWVERILLPARLERWRVGLLALVLAATLSNRTFLAWTSSGLETPLFNLAFLAWTFLATAARRRIGWLALLAAACVAARPEGWLTVGGTLVLALLEGRGALPLLTPLALPVLHLLWRHHTYGQWVPNTHTAKVVSAWPEAGARYLACFVLEYGVGVWLALLLAAASKGVTRPSAGTLIVVCVGLVQVGYYTFVVGGDHFEFRVYSWFVPLLYVTAVSLAARLSERPLVVFGLLGAFVAAGLPIPWTHWARTHELTGRDETHMMTRAVADAFPWPARPVVEVWDGWQGWLIQHHVGMRHQEHARFSRIMGVRLPRRPVGKQLEWEPDHPVVATGSIGVFGWVLPNVAIIDLLGLTDRVVAREPTHGAEEERRMAHERSPPPGYVECFRPNVTFTLEGPKATLRDPPLTDDDIRQCEARFYPR